MSKENSVHFEAMLLRQFVSGSLTDEKLLGEIEAHIERCEFCAEFCEEYSQFLTVLESDTGEVISQSVAVFAKSLQENFAPNRVVKLVPLEQSIAATNLLAADASGSDSPDVVCIGTLYSESPEFVLRIMRDRVQGHDYAQLLSDEKSSIENVLIQIPAINREFITDVNGRADLESEILTRLGKTAWQIKMPDAVFQLKPLQFDPDKVEYSKELILETERADKIHITFLGKKVGKEIAVRVLQLNGKEEFKNVRISIVQDEKPIIKTISGSQELTFALSDTNSLIRIKIFA